MCWSRNSKTLSWLGVMWGLLSLATLLTAFLSNVWLYTKEPTRFPNSDIFTTVTFKIGLWKICPTLKRTNATSRGQHLRQCVLKFHPAFLTTSVGSASENTVKNDIVSPPPGHLPEYPPPTSKRDFVNFPKTMKIADAPPPVRLGFIPESWFQFMYPKTGYTGPYVLLATTFIYFMSKEIIVFDHNFFYIVGFATFCAFVQQKYGSKISEFYDAQFQKEVDLLNSFQDAEIISTKEGITQLKSYDKMKSAVLEVTKARTEFIQLQLENAFRERVMDVFSQVKNKLDCQAELESVEKRMVVKNLVDYVVKNVMSSITPDLEKNVLQACISDLNALATRT